MKIFSTRGITRSWRFFSFSTSVPLSTGWPIIFSNASIFLIRIFLSVVASPLDKAVEVFLGSLVLMGTSGLYVCLAEIPHLCYIWGSGSRDIRGVHSRGAREINLPALSYTGRVY